MAFPSRRDEAGEPRVRSNRGHCIYLHFCSRLCNRIQNSCRNWEAVIQIPIPQSIEQYTKTGKKEPPLAQMSAILQYTRWMERESSSLSAIKTCSQGCFKVVSCVLSWSPHGEQCSETQFQKQEHEAGFLLLNCRL